MKIKSILILIIFCCISCNKRNYQINQFTQFAKEVKYIEIKDIIYQRQSRYIPKNIQFQFKQIQERLNTIPKKDIYKLLNSENPKLRAFGLIGLYNLEEQKAILKCFDFIYDHSVCFKENPYNIERNKYFEIRKKTEEELLNKAKDLTVGNIAKSIIAHYFKQAGYIYFNDDIDNFIQERKRIEYTAGFLKLLKLKAIGGSSSTKGREIFIEELKIRIRKIENKVDRSIYTIYLSCYEYELFSVEERVNAMKFLGKEGIKKILKRQPPTQDPDLLNINNSELYNFHYSQMCKWILFNCKEAFDKNDVHFFIERAAFENNNTRSWRTPMDFPFWHIAAARLDEVNSSIYLKSSLKQFNSNYQWRDRNELYAELWRRQGLKEIDFILDWIFNNYTLNEEERDNISWFFGHLDQEEDILLLKAIIADKRFENSIKVKDVKSIAFRINVLKGQKLINQKLMDKIRHPLGIDRVEWWRDKALKNYPKETSEILERTKELKNELRKIK